jgi:hypothetical protein
VTTGALLDAWLAVHGEPVPSPTGVPAAPEDAIRSANFYTMAVGGDAAFDAYAEIPVRKPGNAALAFAMLDLRTQDIAPGVPDEIAVSVLQDGRFFLFTAPARVEITPVPACDAIWSDFQNKTEGGDSGGDDEEIDDGEGIDDYGLLREEAVARVRDCFAAHAAGEDFFPELVAEVQSLVDRLPAQ